MSGSELKNCPFCGAELIIGKQRIASCKTEGCAVQHRGVDLDYPKHTAAWNRRTPDPAQIRADALLELAEIIRDWRNSIPMTGEECANAILALIDTPLSPPAVDNSPAPDAGGKQPCNECFLPANETCDICGAVGPSGKAGGKEGV